MKEREDLDTKYLGTVFDRQVRIEDWNQDVLAKQTVFCLGAGGLGSVVIMNLLRLGVGKIIILDYDKVDIHNLNRQLMYTIKDVGKSKVQSCIKNAQFHNVGGTILYGFEGCAVTNWHRIVEFAQQSDFIFNMIDYGDWFDAAMQSLCFKLGKPFVMGGTFALSMIVDYLSPKGQPCYWCLTQDVEQNKELAAKIHPNVILTHPNLLFLPKNVNPVGRSSVCICTACGEFMIAHYLNSLFFEKNYKTQRCIFYPTSFETVNFPLECDRVCGLCEGKPKEPEKPKEEEKPAESKPAETEVLKAQAKEPGTSEPKPNPPAETAPSTEATPSEPKVSEVPPVQAKPVEPQSKPSDPVPEPPSN